MGYATCAVCYTLKGALHAQSKSHRIRSGNTKLIVFVTVKFVNVILGQSCMCYFLEIVWNKRIDQTENILFLVYFIFDNTNKSTP